MSNEEIFLRLGVALGLGMLIGFERIYHKHDAGVRTHAITAMGACLFMMMGISIGSNYADNQYLNQEVWRALAQVLGSIIVGIGFLGAGLIFTTDKNNHKKGLTSAATLWTTAAIGAAAGFGFINMAVITTLLVLFTLTFMASLEWTLVKFFKRGK